MCKSQKVLMIVRVAVCKRNEQYSLGGIIEIHKSYFTVKYFDFEKNKKIERCGVSSSKNSKH